MVIIHIHGSEAILYYLVITKTLNLSGHKWEIECLEQNLPRNISKALGNNNIHTLLYGRKNIVSIIHIFGSRVIFCCIVIPRHRIWVTRKRTLIISNNLHPVKPKVYTGKLYPHYTR